MTLYLYIINKLSIDSKTIVYYYLIIITNTTVPTIGTTNTIKLLIS